MNDYVRGAFGALSWVQTLVLDIDPEKDSLEHLDRVVKEVGGCDVHG